MKNLGRLLVLLLLVGCTPSSSVNVQPTARLQLAALGDARLPVLVDATASKDEDGQITTYRYLFGDGTPEVTRPDSKVEHVFPGAGRFQVSVEVTDDKGATGKVNRFITLVDTFTPPYCAQDTDCQAQQVCSVDAGVCLEGP
jgi:hypothetical protein